MAVTIRLARFGKKGAPYYRIVAAHKGTKRDGRYLEILGRFSPLTSPPTIILKEDRVKHWIANGAVTTQVVKDIITKKVPGYIEELDKGRLKKLQDARKARKARAKKSAPKKSK